MKLVLHGKIQNQGMRHQLFAEARPSCSGFQLPDLPSAYIFLTEGLLTYGVSPVSVSKPSIGWRLRESPQSGIQRWNSDGSGNLAGRQQGCYSAAVASPRVS